MHRLTVVVPLAGRSTITGAAPSVQFWFASGPIASTLIAANSAAVVGSVTTKFNSVAEGDPAVSAKLCCDTLKGTTTNGTAFENVPGVPGFSTCSVTVVAVTTSAGVNAVEHAVVDPHVVLRAVPFKRICDAPLPLPATNPAPSTLSGNPSTAPAITLEGSTASIAGPLVIATSAVADFVGSATLVAVTAIEFGEGAKFGVV